MILDRLWCRLSLYTNQMVKQTGKFSQTQPVVAEVLSYFLFSTCVWAFRHRWARLSALPPNESPVNTPTCTPPLSMRVFTCEVDMRDVSWRPVRSEEEMFTGAPRWRRILTFLSFSNPGLGANKDSHYTMQLKTTKHRLLRWLDIM